MTNLQALMNGWSKQWQEDRAGSQMTLGQLIAALENMPIDQRLIGFGRLRSYRGYYCDLSFEPTVKIKTSRQLLRECREAMGKVFQGYKGGDFLMGETTPLWIADYSNTGPRLMGLKDGDIIMPITAEED